LQVGKIPQQHLITKRDGNALTLERIKDPRSSALGNSKKFMVAAKFGA
jgi:hypothetical protein